MKKNGWMTFGILMIGASLLAACGQAATPSAKSDTPIVAPLDTSIPQATVAKSSPLKAGNCTLLSKEEVGKVLGQDVVDVRDEAKSTLCVYQTSKLIFELSFINTGQVSAVDFMKNIRSIHGDPALVPGFGDEAFFNVSPSYQIFNVRKGEHVYTFGVRSEPPSGDPSIDTLQSMEKTLAGLLLSRVA